MNKRGRIKLKKIHWIVLGCIVIISGIGWFGYEKTTDDLYAGMSIIPEKTQDIPLFDGLKPADHEYVVEGNHLKEIYKYYSKELPLHEWTVTLQNSALANEEAEDDWAGFYSRWRKDGFDGELWISAHYNQLDEQTEVIFEQHPIYHSTTWIDRLPERICIYRTLTDETCTEINDPTKIEELAGMINTAIDWKEEVLPRAKTSVMDFGESTINVFYGDDKEMYLQSEKGTKLIKPDPDFFELTNLPQ